MSLFQPSRRALNLKLDRKSVALGFVVLFLSVLLLNSFGQQSGALSLKYFPTVTKGNEPFIVTASLRNLVDEPQAYKVRIFADGVQVVAGESTLDALSTESFTYTRASPEPGSAVRVYAEAVNVQTGVTSSEQILVPQSPPEVWSSFVAFAAFATPTSSSVLKSPTTLAYYVLTLGRPGADGSALLAAVTSVISPLNVGLTISVTLIGLLMFMEFTDPSFGKTGRRLMQLRSRYGWLAAGLLLIFLGVVLTRIIMILA